ncbi:MAG: hypothetical protein NPIRA03_16570 [Nitrospirales bacterium]|nr:MAG: hypothetical protein NPIRA03_16570 [Nitrospirales bacterium]
MFISRGNDHGIAVKKTISLPPDLSRELEEIAQKGGKTISTVIQKALRVVRRECLKSKFLDTQQYWTGKARKGGSNQM